jgi:hypothetical protein
MIGVAVEGGVKPGKRGATDGAEEKKKVKKNQQQQQHGGGML